MQDESWKGERLIRAARVILPDEAPEPAPHIEPGARSEGYRTAKAWGSKTARDSAVLALLRAGKTYTQAAAITQLSRQTVTRIAEAHGGIRA